jgi:hypothetical protein
MISLKCNGSVFYIDLLDTRDKDGSSPPLHEVRKHSQPEQTIGSDIQPSYKAQCQTSRLIPSHMGPLVWYLSTQVGSSGATKPEFYTPVYGT